MMLYSILHLSPTSLPSPNVVYPIFTPSPIYTLTPTTTS